MIFLEAWEPGESNLELDMSFRRLPLLSVLLVLIAFTAAACSSSEPTATPTPTPAPSPTPSPAPSPVALSASEEEYLEQIAAAQALTRSNFENFGGIFGRAWPLREQLISALLEAGVGTAFIGTLEALETLNPPERFKTVHQSLVEGTRELVRLDAEAAMAVENSDMAGFVLLNGDLSETSGLLVIALPGVICKVMFPFPEGNLCSSDEPPAGGEYGARLNELLRQFIPRFQSVQGALGFPLSLSPEELTRVFSDQAPKAERLLVEAADSLRRLTPPSAFQSDHEIFVGYLDEVAGVFSQVTAATRTGDLQTAQSELRGLEKVFCDSRGRFSSADFKSLVGIHFQGRVGPDNCGGEPF